MADLISMLAACAGGGEKDPDFNQTVLLLHGDGTNGAQNNTFLDSSTNNFTITRNGNTTQGTFSPFSLAAGEWSNYFDGATASRFTFASNSDFAMGTGAYTIEMFVYLNAYASTQTVIFDCGQATNSLGVAVSTSGAVQITKYNVGVVFQSSNSLVPLNEWVHISVVRTSTSSNDTRIYINGTLQTTDTDNNDWTVTTTPSIGGINIAGYTVNGYISNLRVLKGVAQAPASGGPNAPLTAISGTVLLTCQSPNFLDKNTQTTAKVLTLNGTIRAQSFSPFNPSSAYSTTTNGGSAYLDGTGDYLSVAYNSAFAFDADFTVEFWVNYSAHGNFGGMVGCASSGSPWNGWQIIFNSSNDTVLAELNNSGVLITSSTTLRKNAWNHVAFIRSGSDITLYFNGVSVGTASSSATTDSVSAPLLVGIERTVALLTTGYFSNIRIVKGQALSTGAFNPPTAPVTTSAVGWTGTNVAASITGTVSILLNFTNAGIFDNTGKNNLETVGNAQIDTTTKKYGTGSMEFDGTGDYLIAPNSSELNLGSGNFTLEGWVYVTSGVTSKYLFGIGTVDSTTRSVAVWIGGTSKIECYYSTSGSTWESYVVGATTISTGVWYHVAFVRNGTTLTLYLNGVAEGTQTGSATGSAFTGQSLLVGGQSGGFQLNGYIDDLRVTKGVARYTAAFTPPTAAFPNE